MAVSLLVEDEEQVRVLAESYSDIDGPWVSSLAGRARRTNSGLTAVAGSASPSAPTPLDCARRSVP